MANALNWLVLFCSLRSFLRESSSLSPDCSIDCQSHCLIDCRQGHYYTAGNCLECPVGFYCPGGQAAPRKCPLGTANGLTGQGASTACQVCPQGYVSLESGAGCRACPEGSRCDPGSGVSRSCDPGQHSPEGELDCGECPEGYVCPDGHSRQRCGAGEQPDPSHTHCVTFSPGPGSGEDTLQCQPCPAGHFCSDGLAVPPCPAGSFKPREEIHTLSSSSLCLPGIGLCLKCPAGYFCPAGASFPVPCQPGTYNPLQGQDEAADCTACPAGRACTQVGLAQPDAECLPGYVCPVGSASPHHPSNACPPGTIGNDFNLFDKSQCETCPAGFVCGRGTGGKQKPPTPCPVGHYCPPGTKHPLQHKCPPGTWSNRTSLSSEEQCFPCPAGWFCVGGARSPTGMCSSGHYCPQGTWRATQYPCPAGTYSTRLGSGRVEDCAACPAGAFCTSGTSKPVLCPVGTYRGEGGAEVAADCIPCPGGYYCPQLGTVAPQTCGAGNFSDQGAASCLPCLVGHYCAGEHTSREVMLLAMACPAGLLCPEGQAAVPDASANACPRGYYCPQGDHSLHAKPCPNGTYGEQRGLSSAAECSPCPVGKYCYRGGMEASGIPHPTGDCPPGYNCPLGTGFPFSFPCMPGFWDNSSTEEADTCQPCPRGFYCDSPATSEPKACPAGFYCVEGSSKPEPCPEGTYSNKKGLSAPSECSPCDHGFYCAAPGQTGPSGPCKAGFYCQGRALTPLPTDGVTGDVCPAGAYCPPGSPLPSPCPPGTYSNLSGLRSLRECLDCPPGLYCDGTNSQAPSGPCAPGYFCPGGARSALQQVVMEGHYSLAGAFKPEPCPLGSFQPDRGQSLCRDCPEGTFCNQTGLAAPQDCPKGHFCLAGSSLPTPCPVGTYRDVVRAGSCRLCPAGMYCSMAALPEPEGHCQPGHYCSQGSTTSSPMGLPFGDLCPRGHYCPAGTTHPRERPCPAGTWNGQRGAQDASWCLPCAPGFFCNMSGQDAPAGLCARGYYCTGRTKTAKPEDGSTGDLCPRGHFCPAGSAAPSPCPTGEYSNATGQDRCFPCPAGFHCSKGLRHRCPPGFYCPQRTGISFYPCPPGTYNPSYGLSQAERCQQCPAGMFCGEWGLSSPSGPCWPGFFCTAGASVPNPTGATNTSTGGPCPPGHFCPVGTSIPQQCPVGTYSDRLYNQQDSSCTACPAGYYCSSAGLTAPSGPCSAGYYCLSGASLPSPSGMWERGGPCPVSHFCPEGSSFPLPCLAGTYNNLTRQAECFPCAAGYYCPENTTSYHQNPCPAGFFCPKGTRFATEFPCPRGYYNPDPMTQSLDSCLPCPPGHYCGKENLTAPSGQCDAGWFCISAAWTSRPFDLDNYTNANCLCPATATGGKCIPGFYCPKGSPEPLSCPPGLYCNASGPAMNTTGSQTWRIRVSCQTPLYSLHMLGLAVPSGECTAGFYCKGGAALPKPTDGVTGNICPVGTYCTAASAVPKLCPAGTFSSLLGRRSLSECQPCPSGFYCEVPGLSAPTGECWEGYYCDNQQGPLIDFTLYPCPQGFYCPPGTNRSTQYSCPAGTFGARPKLRTAKECQRCPPGKYCEFSGLAAPTGDCAEGFWCKSGARVRNPQDGESGIPCPPGHYCPEGAPLPLQCPPGTWAGSEGSGSLQECQPCPGGYYCNSSGQRAPSGHCSPGYYCITRAQSPTPTDGLSGAPCPLSHFCPLGSGSPAPCPPGSYMPHTRGEKCHACPEGEYCASGEKPQPCPQGCFCPKGTALPIACPAGSYNPSERQASCLPCPPGFFCPKNSSSFLENECPAGHYCPNGTASATQFPCPKGTYNPQTGSSLMSHCTPCDPGHYCARVGQSEVTGPCWAGFYCSRGVSTPAPTDGLLGNSCPRGAYCPGGSASPQPCPPGYYSNSTGNTGLEDCLLCDAGYFCNASGLVSPTGLCEAGFYCSGGSISPKPPRTTVSGGPCPPGHYCVVGSSRAQPCPAGSYSPSWSMAQCLECPEGFYCTTGSTDYMDCPAGHYCSRNTEFATQYPCPPGTYSEALNIWDASKCQLCPPGRVCSKPGLTRPDGSCLPGWFCPPGSTASKPMVPGNDSGSYHEKPCPSGHYCPPLASAPLPCPPGTYGSSSFAKHIEDCQACPAGTFNHLPAQAACFPCGSSSSSQPGAASCACHGLNRAFQPSDASCICRAGFVHYDERGKKAPDSNSDQDCQPQVDELCAPGEIRLSATRRCVSPERYDCSPSCGAAGGEISAELGICHCKQYVSAEELCDQLCLLRAPLISLAFGINRELLLRVNEGEVREVTNVLGPDEHVQKSQRVHLVLFSPSGVLGFIVSSVDVLDVFLRGVFSSDQLLQKGRRGQRTSTKDIQALPLIPNPVVCLEAGDTILFQLSINSHDRASSHYPVYQKQHLYNSNPGWDFGPFRRLDHLIQETHLNISWFAHVFLDSGTYVFRDRTIQEHFLIVTVNEANVGCDPRDVSFQPSSLFQLARRGVVKKQELNLAPNWAAITAVLFVLGFLVVMLATLAIVFQPAAPISSPMKSWKPRWRSLGEPHIPPEYILLKDSLQFYQMVGPRGSGEDAGSEEKGAAQNTGEQPVLRVLEDFSVRTLYDKLEDQNLHLAAQLAKHRVDVLVFYNGIRQQVQSLMDMVQGLDSESLKIFAKQRVSGQKPAESSWAAADVEPCGELCSNSLQTGSLGAPWQEATELMKALEMLLGKALHKNIAVKEEMEQKGQAQDAVAVVLPLHSQATESKSAAVEGQDLELPQQRELFNQNDAFFSFPGHKEQGSDLQLAYLTELEVEGLMAAPPLAKTLCDIKQSLVTLQQPSDLVHPDSKHETNVGSPALF